MSHAIFWEPPLENTYLAYQFKEIYIDKVYQPYLEGKTDLTIVDIGASGLTPYYFSQFASKVYAVEPSTSHFDLLMKGIEYNKSDNIMPINKAIYLKQGKFPLFHNANPTMFSLHQAVNDNSTPPEEVEAITFPQLFADYSIEHVDLMKIDVEGTEVELICSTPFKEVAPKIDALFMEVHAWNERNPQQLLDGLKDAGFTNIKPVPNDANLIIATK